ncbi:dienelactone hydrolase family protein [Mycobacterium sp. MYCO198283]|uniref:dienelactone hydrolase family protein n=1 Tax=Mycobacterium sp. MYCO198283 TaxID=2883505 RepID=UPI001E51483F|nr:dienelactone hydrolase family protein [Mycobacterium sp. MYCO198283]MCG5433250.1 dienelactone hydrolase family protein [Mycobacterium sp. MYCO198283]
MPDIRFAAPAGPLGGYLAVPSGDGPWPGVVVVHDAFGLTADTRRICDRFAANGYLALAPQLYGRGRKPACIVATFRALTAGKGNAVDDIVAARDHLAADERCTGKVGCAGFCMGGGFCLLLASRQVFDAAAPNYGVWPPAAEPLRQSCPLVASYGADDRLLPGAAEKLLTEIGDEIPHDVKEYPGVGHSFMNDWGTPAPLNVLERVTNMHYSEPEAEDAWRRILAFFGTHLA